MNKIPAPYIRQVLLLLLIAVIFGVLFWNYSFSTRVAGRLYYLYPLAQAVAIFDGTAQLEPQTGHTGTDAVVVPDYHAAVVLGCQDDAGACGGIDEQLRRLFQCATRYSVAGKQVRIELMTPDNIKTLTSRGVDTAQYFLGMPR